MFDLVFPNIDKDAMNTLWKKELKKPKQGKRDRDREEKTKEDEEEEDEDSDSD